MKAVREVAEGLLGRHHAAVVVHIFHLHVGLVAVFVIELHYHPTRVAVALPRLLVQITMRKHSEK